MPSGADERVAHRSTALVALAVVGFAISAYLAAFELGFVTDPWDPFFGDGSRRVLTSAIAGSLPVPAEADEDARRCIRERAELVAARVALVNRIGAGLATVGVGDYNPLRRTRREGLGRLRQALRAPARPRAAAMRRRGPVRHARS